MLSSGGGGQTGRGAAIGGALGGLCSLALLSVVGFILLRRRRNRREMEIHARLFERLVFRTLMRSMALTRLLPPPTSIGLRLMGYFLN